jgi:hypothetical protein
VSVDLFAGNGVRKIIYRDPEGNEIGIGGPPA